MRIIALSTLRNCWIQHPKSEASLKEWYTITSKAVWQKPSDVTDAFSTAKYLGDNRFRFKIRHNAFHLVVHINFETQIVYIRFAGSHSDRRCG